MYLSRETVRELDRRAVSDYGIPPIVLMENAGRSAAGLLQRLLPKGPVAVCCGKGNNAGDGFVLARHLDNIQMPVTVLMFARPEALVGDTATAFGMIARSGIALEPFYASQLDFDCLSRVLSEVTWVVDALFGTGLQGPVRPPFDGVIGTINASCRQVLAIDVPSGLDCDLGLPRGPTVKAHHTATMAAAKLGFARPEAAPWIGHVHVMDIGIPRRLLDEMAGSSRNESQAPSARGESGPLCR